MKLGQYAEALQNLTASLAISRDLKSPAVEAEVLKNLAELYHQTQQPDLAREHGQQALALATELGIPLQAECEALLKEWEGGKGKG